MSTLLEIEEAIETLPGKQVAELASWLHRRQAGNGEDASFSEEEILAAQVEVARLRMTALDAGRSQEIPGAEAHAMVRNFIARPA